MTALPEPLTKRARKALRRTARSKREPRTLPVREVEMPTPERIAHAGEGYRSVIVDGERRTKITEAPLDVLFARGKITPAMYDAGVKFRNHWYLSGLSGIGAINYGHTIRGEGGTPWAMPLSEKAAYCRAQWREADRALGRGNTRTVVGIVVLDELSLEEAGRRILGIKARSTAITEASDVVKSGLQTLVKHYRME
jgi:hypothetical protein